MNFKQWAVACAVALAGPAIAGPCTSTKTWGDLGPPAFQPFGNSVGIGSFNDCYTFNLSASATAFGGVYAFDLPGNTLDINISAVSLFAGANLLSSDSSPGYFKFGDLGAGSYRLVVTGNVSSVPGFVQTKVGYIGTVTTVAAPVPEPEAYALMLAGFFGVGVGVLRRKKS
jgi:hypothetical protein